MPAPRRHKCSLAAAVLACLPSLSTAALNIDLRATSLNGVGLSGANTSKSVRAASVGDVVAFDVFAVVVGTNALTSADKFVSAGGSFKSVGSTKGNLLLDLVRSDHDPDPPFVFSGFDGLGSSIGAQQDLDGDTDIDVGSNVDSNAEHFWAARFALAPAGSGAGSTNPLTNGRRIGFGTFTVSAFGLGPTSINFFGRNATTASNYIQDGAFKQERSFDGLSPIQILVPEPATFSIAFVALGALRRRPLRAHPRCMTMEERR